MGPIVGPPECCAESEQMVLEVPLSTMFHGLLEVGGPNSQALIDYKYAK